jgi:hypothetical protein
MSVGERYDFFMVIGGWSRGFKGGVEKVLPIKKVCTYGS